MIEEDGKNLSFFVYFVNWNIKLKGSKKKCDSQIYLATQKKAMQPSHFVVVYRF